MVRLLIEMDGKASMETVSNMKSKKILKNVEGQNENNRKIYGPKVYFSQNNNYDKHWLTKSRLWQGNRLIAVILVCDEN